MTLDYPAFLSPIALQLGPIPLRWYSLSYVFGIGLAWVYGRKLVSSPNLWAKPGAPISKLQLDDLIFWVTIGVILGGRVGYILFYRQEMLLNPLEMLKVWEGGLSFHGGFLGVTLAGLLYARKHGLNAWRLGDLFACATPIAIFLVRLANFANAELYGRVTSGAMGIKFPVYDPPLSRNIIGYTEPRHPSQLYEAGLEGLMLFSVLALLTWKFKLLHRPGAAMGIFIAGYGLSRILVENVREPDVGVAVFFDLLTRGMMLSIPMVLAGAWLLYRAWRGTTPKPKA